MAGPRIDRTERLLNLVFALMGSGQPVSRAAIAASIPGYDPSSGQAAFERMFERDKDELRSLGIPVRTVLDVNGDVSGYTIDRDDYALPGIHFSAAERSALALAATTWRNALVRSNAAAGLRKLESDAQSDDLSEDPAAFIARISSGEQTLLSLLSLLRARVSVEFDYRAPDAESEMTRHVDPWGIVAHEGGWYLVGHDRDRAAVRVFRLSRMRGEPRAAGEPECTAPAGIDLRSYLSAGSPDAQPVQAIVNIRAGAGASIRRLATIPVEFEGVQGLEVQASDEQALVSAALFAGDGVEVVESAALRAEIVAALTAIRDAHQQVSS